MAALFTDRQFFNCYHCAVTPRLQKLNGCFEEVPQVLVRYADFEFNGCPRAAFGALEEMVAGYARVGMLEKTDPATSVQWPAKLYAALRFSEELLRNEAKRDHRD